MEEVQAEEFCRWFLFGVCVQAGWFGSAWLYCSHFYRVVSGVLGTGSEEIRWVYGRLGAVAGEAAGTGKRQGLCWGSGALLMLLPPAATWPHPRSPLGSLCFGVFPVAPHAVD